MRINIYSAWFSRNGERQRYAIINYKENGFRVELKHDSGVVEQYGSYHTLCDALEDMGDRVTSILDESRIEREREAIKLLIQRYNEEPLTPDEAWDLPIGTKILYKSSGWRSMEVTVERKREYVGDFLYKDGRCLYVDMKDVVHCAELDTNYYKYFTLHTKKV